MFNSLFNKATRRSLKKYCYLYCRSNSNITIFNTVLFSFHQENHNENIAIHLYLLLIRVLLSILLGISLRRLDQSVLAICLPTHFLDDSS